MLSDLDKNSNTINWASKVKELLSSLGFYEVWLNQGAGNKDMFCCFFFFFVSELRTRLSNNFIQNWNSRITEPSRAFFFNDFSNFYISRI